MFNFVVVDVFFFLVLILLNIFGLNNFEFLNKDDFFVINVCKYVFLMLWFLSLRRK